MIFTEREMAQLRHLEILAAKVSKGQLMGERETSRAGPGSGFREHRAYTEGDPLRMVDWHVYARMDAMVVKEFEAEETLDVVLVHDRSASMRGDAALCAAKVAAGLGASALSQLDRVVWLPAGGSRPAKTLRGRGQLYELLGSVEAVAEGPTDLLAAVRSQLPRTSSGGVAFVLTDGFDPRGVPRALSYLLGRRYQLRLILIEDTRALAPPPVGAFRLVDAETGAAKRIDITAETIAAYQHAIEKRALGLRAFCRRSGVGFLRVRADQPFFEIVRTCIARGWLTR